MDLSRILENAGVGILDRVPSTPGGHTPGAFGVLSHHWSHVWTSQIPEVRGDDAIRSWVCDQQATLGAPSTYYLQDATAWLQLSTADPAWLARIWPLSTTNELLVVSGDGSRCLLLMSMYGVPDIRALAYATSAVLAMHLEHNQLFEVLQHPEVLCVAYPPAPRRVHADEVFRVSPLTTLPASATHERRDAWVTDAFHRWRLQGEKLDDASLGDHLGPYDVSLAQSPYLLTLRAWALTPTAIATIWRSAHDERLVLLDDERTRSLAISRAGDTFEARVTDLT